MKSRTYLTMLQFWREGPLDEKMSSQLKNKDKVKETKRMTSQQQTTKLG
jgi:hypothetical protein